MVEGSEVHHPDGRVIQLHVGDKHEIKAKRQADALNEGWALLSGRHEGVPGHKVVPVWVEQKINRKGNLHE